MSETIKVLFSVGNGTSDLDRHNAMSVGESVGTGQSYLFVDNIQKLLTVSADTVKSNTLRSESIVGDSIESNRLITQIASATLIHNSNIESSTVLHRMIREHTNKIKLGTPVVYTGIDLEIREMIHTDTKHQCIGVVAHNHRGVITHCIDKLIFSGESSKLINISHLYDIARLNDKITYVSKSGVVILRKDVLHLNIPKSWIKVSDYDEEHDLYDIK